LSTTNPIWKNPGAKPGLRGERPATNRLNYDTAYVRVLTSVCSIKGVSAYVTVQTDVTIVLPTFLCAERGPVADCCKYGEEPAGSGVTESAAGYSLGIRCLLSHVRFVMVFLRCST